MTDGGRGDPCGRNRGSCFSSPSRPSKLCQVPQVIQDKKYAPGACHAYNTDRCVGSRVKKFSLQPQHLGNIRVHHASMSEDQHPFPNVMVCNLVQCYHHALAKLLGWLAARDGVPVARRPCYAYYL